jgi:hypothetical protein
VAQKLPERSTGDESAPLRKRGTESDEVAAASDD